MRISHQTQVSRSRSQHLITEEDLKKAFPFTQHQHNRYLGQNRLASVKDALNNEQQQSISSHIKELMTKDKQRPRLLQPINLLDETMNREIGSNNSLVRSKLPYHDSQNVNLHNQTQRREMVQLAQWLDLMVDKLHALNLNDYQDFYNRLEAIYSGSVLELQRQISSTGFEFGQFLKKLWDSFVDQIQKIIDGLAKRNSQIEQQGFEEINRLHLWYQDAIQKQTAAVQQMKEEVTQVQTAIAKLKKENVYFRKKDNRRERLMHEFIIALEHQGSRLMELEAAQRFQAVESAEQIELELQQQEIFQYFRNQFDTHKKQVEHNYKAMLEQEEFYEFTRDIILQDASCETVDLIKKKDAIQDTLDICSFATTFTQTPKQKKMVDEEVQVQPYVHHQENQANFYMIKRDRVARNVQEQRLFRKAKLNLEAVISEFSKFYFPEQELSSNNPQYLTIIDEQMKLLQERSDELLGLLNLRAELQSEDVAAFKNYLSSTYEGLLEYFKVIARLFKSVFGIVQSHVSTVIDAKIDKEELEIDIRYVEDRFASNVQLLRKFHAKSKQKENISKFFERSLIKVIRYAPQSLINQVKEEATGYGVLQNMDFKEIKKRTGTMIDPRTISPPKEVKDQMQSSQTQFNKSQTKMTVVNARSSATNISAANLALKFISNIKNTRPPSMPEIQDNEDDNYKSDSENEQSSSESDISLANIKLDLAPNKPQLTIEKKLRINTCLIKSAQYSTNVLKHILQKFNHNNKTGLYKLSTLLQNYQDFIIKIKNTTQSAPMHVHLYESIVAHYGQSQFSDANRYKRTLRSFLFYQNKHNTCRLVVKFLKAELDVQDLGIYLQILQNVNEYPSLLYVKFMEAITKMFQANDYSQREIDEMVSDLSTTEVGLLSAQQGPVEYDALMDGFLTIYQKYKNRTTSKYKHLYSAVDYKNKGSIDYFQWNFLYGVLVQLNTSFSIKLFHQEADYQDEFGKMMSKQRFTLVCDELKLFQQEDQQKLLDNEEPKNIIEKLQRMWSKEKIMMKMSFIKAEKYDKFIKGMFASIDQFLVNPNKSSLEMETICYIYKLLAKTYKPFFLETQLTLGLPVEFQLMAASYRQLEIKLYSKD